MHFLKQKTAEMYTTHETTWCTPSI